MKPSTWANGCVQQVKERLRWFVGRKALWRCAIGTPQGDGKREGCVLSRAKLYLLFRKIEISSKKKLIYRETILSPIKTSGLSCENTLVLHSSSHLFRESRHSNWPPLRVLSSRTRTCARTDTHLHIAHSTSLFFLPSPFTFTPNTLSHCGLRVKKTINLTLHGWRKMGWNLHL